MQRTKQTDVEIIKMTKKWVEKTIIGLELCPFAKIPWEQGLINIQISHTQNLKQIQLELEEQIIELTRQEGDYSTLFIFNSKPQSFFDFNDDISILSDLLRDLGVHLIGFHPQFMFKDTDMDQACNFVNRSPFPIIHLLKKDSLDFTLDDSSIGERISQLNEKKIAQLSQAEMKEYFWYLYDN